MSFHDPESIGDLIGHLRAYRAILSLLARKLHDEQIDPDDDHAAIEQLNLEVAHLTGHNRH